MQASKIHTKLTKDDNGDLTEGPYSEKLSPSNKNKFFFLIIYPLNSLTLAAI